MADEQQAPIQPFPGGDARIHVIGLVGTAAVNGVLLAVIYFLRPDKDNSAFYAALTAALAPTYGVFVSYLRGHATGNAVAAMKDKIAADAEKDRLDAAKAQAAVTASALDKQEIKEAVAVNTALTVAIAEKAAPEAAAVVLRGSKP